MADEIHIAYLRIQARKREPLSRIGYEYPRFLQLGDNRLTLSQESIVLRACSDSITTLSRRYRWMGYLDSQVPAVAFHAGLVWGATDSSLNRSEKRSN
jgi:hypothetical protein